MKNDEKFITIADIIITIIFVLAVIGMICGVLFGVKYGFDYVADKRTRECIVQVCTRDIFERIDRI